MPELPEVEVIRRTLAPHVVGRRVTGVRVRQAVLRRRVDVAALARGMTGRRIAALSRRAKYLLIHLQEEGGPERTVALHLGMSGRLTLVPRGRPANAHEHVVVSLASGAGGLATELRFRDPRRFGMVEMLPAGRWQTAACFRHLGPEPFDDRLDAASLRRRARGRRAPIKNLIMDARFVVGVGNIYASEALFTARVDPRTPAGTVGRARWDRILRAVRDVLRSSIEDGGTSLVDFRDGNGERGLHAVRLEVYGRAGGPCRRCGRKIRRLVQAGRSTFFCTRCQR